MMFPYCKRRGLARRRRVLIMDAKAKILIVDDELSTRVKLQRILAKADYDVQAAAGGQEAL